MRILELLAFAPLTIAQLSEAVQAHPRTVRRVVERLVADEYVAPSPARRGTYEPTMRFVALAAQILDNSDVARRARPYIELLYAGTDHAAHLVAPSYHAVVCLVHCAGDEATRPRLRELVPAHATAGGKALLAWREPWCDSVLAGELSSFTEATITDPAALRRDLHEVRARGYATEDGEYERRVSAVAAPVVVDNIALAAVSVSGRGLDPQAVAERVTGTARDLAQDLAATR
jgi:DNA-binding IclR family transcriptional regulator